MLWDVAKFVMTRRYNHAPQVVNLRCDVSKRCDPANHPRTPSEVFKALRGLAPEEFDEPMARALGAAFAKFTQSDAVVIGRDMDPQVSPRSVKASSQEST